MRIETVSTSQVTRLHQGLIWFDAQSRVVDLNLQAARMLRADPGWMLLQDFFSLCGQAQPHPGSALLAVWQEVCAGRLHSLDQTLWAANGVAVPLSLSFSRRLATARGGDDRILALALDLGNYQ